MFNSFYFISIKLYFKFWGTFTDHAGLLHRYTHGNVVCCLHPPSPTSGISPHVIAPQPPHSSALPPLAPTTTDPSVLCSPPCVHVFSLFIIYLWLRTCGVWIFCSCVSLLRMMVSRFIHVSTNDTNSSFF